MGARGPVPDREENLARPRSRKGDEQGHKVTHGLMRDVTIPDPDPNWHPIARMVWDGLRESGQSDFFQSSDWAFAYSLCEDLHHYKMPNTDRDGNEYHKRSGQMLQTIYSAMSDLLVSEGHRRRVGIELQKPEEESNPASLAVLDDYREGLGMDDNPEEASDGDA